MESLKLNGYNLLNPMNGKQQQIIDCFVEFFGEENRELITNKIKSSTYLFLPKSENGYELLTGKLEAIQKKERNKFIEKFYKEMGYKHQKVTNRVFTPELAVFLKNKIETGKLNDSDYKSLAEVLFCKFNVSYNKNGKELVDSWLMSAKDKRKIIDFLSEVTTKWKTSKEREDMLIMSSEIQEIVTKINQIKEFTIKENNLANEEVRNLILKKFSEIKKVSADELLKNPHTEEHINQMKKIALNARTNLFSDAWFDDEAYRDIKMYNFLGFSYGFDYNSYLDEPRIMDNLLGNEFIGEIQSTWAKHMKNIIKNDIFLNNAYDVVNGVKFYCNKGYVLKEITDFSSKTTGGIASTLNVFDKNRQLINVCVFDSPILCGDDTLIHELCHVVSSYGEISKDLLAKINCGVSKVKVQDTDTSDFTFESLLADYSFETTSSKSLMLNEVITDYFSYKIQDIFRMKNLQVCKGKNELSYYAWMFGMMQDLIEDNIAVFKRAYITGNISELTAIMSTKEINSLSEAMDKIFITYTEYSFKKFEKEIKEKTGLKENVLYNVKPYINKDLGWSTDIKEFFEYYKNIDKIAENIKNKQEKLKNNDKNK